MPSGTVQARKKAVWASAETWSGSQTKLTHASTVLDSASTAGRRARAEALPREQRQHERDRVVDGVPGVEHAAQEQQQRQQQQRVRASATSVDPGQRGQRQRDGDDQRVADDSDPAGRRPVADLDFAEQAAHRRSVMTQEPEDLPRLEDRAGRRGCAARGGDEPARADERERREDDRRHCAARSTCRGLPASSAKRRGVAAARAAPARPRAAPTPCW